MPLNSINATYVSLFEEVHGRPSVPGDKPVDYLRRLLVEAYQKRADLNRAIQQAEQAMADAGYNKQK